MRRRLFTVCAALSLLLCAAACVLWVRSHYVEHTLYRGTRERADAISIARGRVVIELLVSGHPVPGWRHETCSPGKWPRTAHEMGTTPAWSHIGIEWSPDVNLIGVSLWWAVTLTAAMPVACVVTHHPRTKGLCPRCGYDLRASPERCPECGTARSDAV